MSKVDKYLAGVEWYHGTTLSEWENIKKSGIIVDYNKGNELDFGYGFYLTPFFEQARDYILKIQEFANKDKTISYNSDEKDKISVVIVFEFNPIDCCNNPDYRFGVFDAYDDAFAEFVFYNRVYNVNGESQHEYDIIFGVMSDSVPIILIQKYKNGEIVKEEVIEQLKKSTSVKQLSLYNQKLCDIIKPKKVIIIETGEELNIDDYSVSNKR